MFIKRNAKIVTGWKWVLLDFEMLQMHIIISQRHPPPPPRSQRMQCYAILIFPSDSLVFYQTKLDSLMIFLGA